MVGKRRADMTPEELEFERAKHREYMKKWREAHPELAREAGRRAKQRYKEAHPEQYKEAKKAYVRRRLERAKAADGEELRHIRELQFAAKRRWIALHPEEYKAQSRRYTRRHVPLTENTTRKLMRNLEKAIPRGWPRQDREEVLMLVYMAVAEGHICVRDAVASIGHYSKQNNREYDTHKNVSLDVAHPVTGQAWVENLDSETPHF